MTSPYRDGPPPRLTKLPNENSYIRVDEVVAVEEQEGAVVILFRNGQSVHWTTDKPAELAKLIADTINSAP
jgi:hypothetical protein